MSGVGRVALTGAIPGMSRSAFKDAVAAAGGAYVPTLEEGVSLLVTGERPLVSKVARARELGVEVVDWDRFRQRLTLATPDEEEEEAVPLAEELPGEASPSLELHPDRVRILDLVLPRRPSEGPMVPSASDFDHYTLDAPTLALLRFVARAVLLRHPCLLEGDTATSKTSAVLYFAALVRQPVVRLNLNGQTDASELVGRYVPDPTGAATWRFQEGLVPQAMRQGWWIVLDEVNLAEPAVLERLNPVLERQPSLVLTEGEGTRFGPGGDVAVHRDFRVFATMNPAEYQGRSVLSPAWRDRFVATYQVEAPGELEYRQMLERIVFGRQPDVEVEGLHWGGFPTDEAPYGALARVPGLETFLSRLAALHAALVSMATSSEGRPAALGVARRERYVFSRRGLLAVLDALLRVKLHDPRTDSLRGFSDAPEVVALDALERTYLDRIRGEEDRGRVVSLLRSLGLSRDGWVTTFS